MIKIQPNNIESIVEQHWKAVHPVSSNRIHFCVTFFETALRLKSIPTTITKIETEYGIHYNSAIAIVKKIKNNFGKEKTKKKKEVNQNSILRFMKRQDTSLLSSSSRNLEFNYCVTYLQYIQTKLKVIVTGKPDELKVIKEEITTNFTNHTLAVKSLTEFIFPYETFSKDGFQTTNGLWNNYSLTKGIGVQVCPYCNRSWINTVIEGKTKTEVINPQLDHFYSQGDFPYFRLSFYNLIPSCEACNGRLKHGIEFDDTYLHPYIEGYGADGKFRTTAINVQSSIGLDSAFRVHLLKQNKSISPEIASKIEKNHELFEIDKIYEAHGEIISEIYRKKHISNDKYLEMLSKQFPALSRDRAELYRIGFGNFYNESDFNKRPFAKLTKDVAEQLGLI